MRTRFILALTTALAVLTAVLPASAQQPQQGENPRSRGGRQYPPVAPGPRDALTRALERKSLTPARYALERARSLFDLEGARRRHGAVEKADARAVTMILRDLFLRIPELSPTDRMVAESVLARPTDGSSSDPGSAKYGRVRTQRACRTPLRNSKAGFCVHRARNGPNKSTKGQLVATVKTMNRVWRREVGKGRFPAPKSDKTSKNNGGNKKTDIYLANIGSDGYYGYCTSDDPKISLGMLPFSFSAYCVLDNDFKEFPGKPAESRRVTAAHEFFHAIQFRMDAGEDIWMMEGTAAAIEDHVYNGINDNYQFLQASQFEFPHVPADYTDNETEVGFYFRYGSWIFWRHMMEFFNSKKDPKIKVLRALWKRADSRKGRPDDYSIQAAVNVTKAKGRDFTHLFSNYGVSLLLPRRFKEGAGYLGRFQAADGIDRMPKQPAIALSSTPEPATGPTHQLDHLSHAYVPIEKSDTGFTEESVVDLSFDLPEQPSRRGSSAKVVSVSALGATTVKTVTLDANGDGTLALPFGPDVAKAIVILTNASTRFKDCWSYAMLVSCGGTPVDDDQPFSFQAALRPPPSP